MIRMIFSKISMIPLDSSIFSLIQNVKPGVAWSDRGPRGPFFFSSFNCSGAVLNFTLMDEELLGAVVESFFDCVPNK